MDIFRGIFRLFWGETISQYSSGWLLVKDLYLISEPNSFSGAAQRQLSKCNQRNTVICISNQNLKISRSICQKFLWKKTILIFSYSQIFTGKNLWWSLFLVKLKTLTLLKKDSVIFLRLFKILKPKKNSITASQILKFLILKKGLRYFLTTFKVINAQKGLHDFYATLKIFNTEKGYHHCLDFF